MVGLETSEFDIIMTAIVDPLHPRWKAIDRLLRQKLWLEQLVAVTPESFPVGYVTWEDLAGRIVLCRSGDDWRRFVNHVRELGGPTLDFSEQNVALDSLLGLVAAGTGWCILPASSARDDVANTKILPIISEGATLQVEAFWRPEVDNPALTRLLALARQMFTKTNQA
jgi:DNA-binding transcriptional LysR family regulator